MSSPIASSRRETSLVRAPIELRGDRVVLRSTIDTDRSALITIRSTEAVRRRWRGDDLEAEFDEDLADDEVHQLTIRDQHGRVVGLIQFGEEQDPDYRHASLDIYVDPELHRNGFASDAIRTVATYLFDALGHHRLTIDPAADNEAAIACYAKVGFETVGTMRAYERRTDGTWADGVLMEMVASDR